MDVITTVTAPVRAGVAAADLISDTRAFVGEAAIEGELLDSLSGERVAAVVDNRFGTRSTSGMSNTWSDVKEAYDYWSMRFAVRLRELRDP